MDAKALTQCRPASLRAFEPSRPRQDVPLGGRLELHAPQAAVFASIC